MHSPRQKAWNLQIFVTYPLAEVKKKPPSGMFIQTHRSFLVNMKLVEKFIGNMLYVGKILDNIKDTLGKNILPSGKQNPPLGEKIGSKNEDEVISDDEVQPSGGNNNGRSQVL